MIRQIALFSELTRARLEYTLGEMAKTASKSYLQTYFDLQENAPIKEAIKLASARTGIDDPELSRMVEQSMRYRVFAGILNIKITVPEEEPLGGVCGCQEYDEATNSWPCKVPGNQEAADAWHAAWGNSPACPYWKDPTPKEDKAPQNELEKLFAEGEDMEKIWRELGLMDESQAGRHHH
jgi:hypothetical protein